MNHCVLEVEVKNAPTLRYTQDNKTPIAEMEVSFDGLRTDDPQGEIKAVGWGNMAQELQNKVKEGQRLILEGRLRMNTVPRQDGTKEKKAELTISKMSFISQKLSQPGLNQSSNNSTEEVQSQSSNTKEENISWDSSPLIPDTDEIPF